MSKSLAAIAALTAVSALSCRRPLGQDQDAGGDGGGPSVGDAARFDVAVGDVPGGDGARDVAFEIAPDGFARDVGADLAADAPREAVVAAMCPADVQPLDVCGCGCCGGVAGELACYYPSLGESRDTIPNPMPTPQQCATAGCSYGTRYACCADPGPQPAPSAIFCSVDASKEDLPLFAFTKRDGETCTTVEMGLTSGKPPQITTPFGNGDALGLRGPCDSFSGLGAIGGVGSITLHPSSTGDGNHYDVHVALFFDTRTGIADVSRIDVDDIALTSCPATGCQPCMGACAFDATYRYGFVGGRVSWVDTAVIAPPAAYQHIRSPVTTMPADITCAPAPPACGGPAIDVGDVMAAFGDADVQDALARSKTAGTYPFYGQDPRPSDGQAFQLTRDGGGGFLIGGPCPPGSTASSCTEIPGGLSRLKSVLLAFDQQQLQADPTCAQLRP